MRGSGGYKDYLLNKAYRPSDPNDPSTWLSFYSTDDPDWSGNHVQNGLLVFDPAIWGNPRGNDPKAIQTLSFLRAPVIRGLRGFPVSMQAAQGGVFSPSGKVLYLAAGYTGDESESGEIGNAICYLLDCNTPSDYGVVTAIDANSGLVLETSGHGVGWFNYELGSWANTNEPEGLDFFDTACYAADHGGQPPTGFGLSQLHAMVNNDNLDTSGVYLKHYTGQGQGSMCDSGFGSDVEMVQQALRANRGVGFCAGNLGTSGLACSDFEVTDRTDWSETEEEEPSVWAIRNDRRKGLDSTILVETANDNRWYDYKTCGGSAGFPQDRTVSASVTLASSTASADQGAIVYGLYQEGSNAYYAYLRTDGNIELGKRQHGDPMTIATAAVAPPGTTWHALSLQLVSTTDTVHPPAGGLWAVVSLDGMPVIDQLADSAPGWTSACAGVGTFGIQAAFDDFLVTSP